MSSTISAGNGSRRSQGPRHTDHDELQLASTHRDAVHQLSQLYCELGTVTFDFVDGRLLSQLYAARRMALCTEIRRQLAALASLKATAHR